MIEENSIYIAKQPEIIWEWYIFGDDTLIFYLTKDVNLYRRIITWIIFGSKWKRGGG